MKSICVIGLWHLGLVNCIGFAELGFRVIGVDFDKALVSKLQKGVPPLYEPGLKERMVRHLKSKKLSFNNNLRSLKNVDYIIIAYDSPINEKDEVDISPITAAAKKLAPYLNPNIPIVITSQIPLGTSEKIEILIKKVNPSWKSGVVYTPENLRLGSAIERFLKPDMIVLGSNNPLAQRTALKLYQHFQTKKFIMNLRSAEMVKHALNTFLATSITFANEIANLCERLGADALAVGMALKADRRVGQSPVLPGLGFSGGTLARDVYQLKKFADGKKYDAPLLKSIIKINEGTFDQVVLKLAKKLVTLKGKTIGLLGLTYKPGTSTLRQSPAIKIIGKLVKEGASCLGYDPKADAEEIKTYSRIIKRLNSVTQLVEQSDALLLLTEWPEFKDLEYNKLARLMKHPIIIDAKNYLDPKVLKKSGFDYEGYGRSVEEEEK